MATTIDTTAVGVFDSGAAAEGAVADLRDEGFPASDIGVAGGTEGATVAMPSAGLGAAGGLLLSAAAMAGYAVTWVLVFYPAVWTAYIGGASAAALAAVAAVWAVVEFVRSSAARRRVAAVAPGYESDLRAGRAVVTVRAGTRCAEAVTVLRDHGALKLAPGAAQVAA